MARLIELKQTAPERFLARFDTGEEVRTTLAVVTDFHLRSGKELTSPELDALRAASERSRCRQRALRIIGARAMSVKELTDRLKEKGESPENAEDAAAWLQELHLLDDAQYAAMCVRHYAAKGYGAGRIRSELYRRGIPRELDEAASIDGCGSFRTLVRILMPLCKPALVSVGLFNFIWTWNAFMDPLIYISSVKKYPLSLALRMTLDLGSAAAWNEIFAMSVLSIVPPVLLFFAGQKYFIQGISTSGLKG